MSAYQYEGGAIAEGGLYVPRPQDRDLIDRVLAGPVLATLVAPRQSGKSSLLENLRKSAIATGHRAAIIDLRLAVGTTDARDRKPLDFFHALFDVLSRELDIAENAFAIWWEARQEEALVRKVHDFFAEFVRKECLGPVLIGIDEIDWVALHGYHTDEMFDGFRLLASKPAEHNLSVVLAGINHPVNLLKSLPPSTFNISHDIALRDFGSDDETVAAWSAGLPWDEGTRMAVGRAVLEQTGGQPFLTSVLFQDVLAAQVQTPAAVAKIASNLVEEARGEDRLKAHFQGPTDVILAQETRTWQALALYELCLTEPQAVRAVFPPILSLLRMAGLVREKGGMVEVKSPIYRGFFDAEWAADVRSRIGSAQAQTRKHSKKEPDAICVINTGGMISMELMPDGRIAEPQNIRDFFKDFPEMREIADIDPLALMCKDSSNMVPADWRAIAEAIYTRRNRGYKGFVVAHGTDTLAYTASAVAYALGPGLNFPVVFTAAQVPRHVLHGDARINLLRACTVATKPIPEVVVSIGDYVYRAVRAEKRDDYRFDSFHSPTLPPLAIIAGDVELQRQMIRKADESRHLDCKARFEEGIFKLSFYPGLDPTFIQPVLDNPAIKGLIIETPGIGVLPTQGRNSLLPLIEDATGRQIPVLLVSQYPIQKQMSEIYDLAGLPVQAGAMVAAMTAPAAVTKFMWVLPQVQQDIDDGHILPADKLTEVKHYMNRNIIGELTSESDR